MSKRKRPAVGASESSITDQAPTVPGKPVSQDPRPLRRQSTRAASAATFNPDETSAISVECGGVAGGAGSHAVTESNSETAVNTGAQIDRRGQPGTKKRKQPFREHVKLDGAIKGNAPTCALLQDAGTTADPVEDVGLTVNPESDERLKVEDEEEEEVKEALSRPPPVNSNILPLPWKGRLGYACLNTYLRTATPPVFSSRTCRIASILEHRHPLKDPSQPEHATKNRPDREQPADHARGQRYVEELGLANARDIIKMVRWNDKFGIKFMRLSSEMFPFASHQEYGYKLEPFAAETLAEAGKVIAELGHRVTTHPGQFTQLGSPRKEVITAAIRDLEYHDEMLSLLKLPPQQDRDAVMILHLGGVFGDKAATLDRFRENYAKLSPSVKRRLVLENDDVSWSVHDVLPVCQQLNIPFVLDFHHHNIIFDSGKIREGTKDIIELFPAIIETWRKKGITPKMHYSEPCPDAVTARSRRKHSARVMTLPPCPKDMDLMIEAKDKEQAVFELMRTFKLPGFDLFNDVIPHMRQDENKPFKPTPKKAAKKNGKKKTAATSDELELLEEKIELEAEEAETPPPLIQEQDISMGGPDRRVYWPPGMEHWLRPPKRVVKKKEEKDMVAAPAKKRRIAASVREDTGDFPVNGGTGSQTPVKKIPRKKIPASINKAPARKARSAPTPSPSEESSPPSSNLDDSEDEAPRRKVAARAPAPIRQRSGRASRVSYKEEPEDSE